MENKLQQAKDVVAKKYGYETFEQFDDKSTFGYNHDTSKIIDEIAIVYNRLCNEEIKTQEQRNNDEIGYLQGLIDDMNGVHCEYHKQILEDRIDYLKNGI